MCNGTERWEQQTRWPGVRVANRMGDVRGVVMLCSCSTANPSAMRRYAEYEALSLRLGIMSVV